jgi:hypothetical protein
MSVLTRQMAVDLGRQRSSAPAFRLGPLGRYGGRAITRTKAKCGWGSLEALMAAAQYGSEPMALPHTLPNRHGVIFYT